MKRRVPSGFETFYRTAKDPCFRALLATVGSADEADDLLAEAFTRALANWGEVSRHPRPEAWVVRVALNLHRDSWRRSIRRRRHLERADTVPFTEPFDSGLLDSVRRLPVRQREVVALRVLLDLSAEQTAEILDIEAGTVGTHLRRALATLRANVEAAGADIDSSRPPTPAMTLDQASIAACRADASVSETTQGAPS